MIEQIKLLFHSVFETLRAKAVEIMGYSVSGTLLIISQMSVLALVEKTLQICVLIVSLAGGIATYIYVRKKTKKLDK